jgi:uncharacterized membrane protein YhhN
MGELFGTGRVVDLVLALMVVEAVALGLLWTRTARGVPPIALIVNLVAGALLLLALRAALTDAGPAATASFLGLALVAHLADLALRWQRRDGGG